MGVRVSYGEEMVKLVIISRFFCADGELDCTDDCSIMVKIPEQMHYYSRLASTTIAPSLRNQTDQDFSHYTIIHNHADPVLMSDHQHILEDAGLSTTLIPYGDYESELRKIHLENDAVCFSAMDNDDLVNKHAVYLAKQAYVPNRLTVHGYSCGMKMDLQTNSCVQFKHDYKGLGHIRIMQSFLFDRTTGFYNPYLVSHTKTKKSLELMNDPFADDDLIKYGDADCENGLTYVYIKHSKSRSFRKFHSRDSNKPNLTKTDVFPDNITQEEFQDVFGIAPQRLVDNFKTIVEGDTLL